MGLEKPDSAFGTARDTNAFVCLEIASTHCLPLRSVFERDSVLWPVIDRPLGPQSPMTSLKQELYNTFQSLINQRDRLRLELVHAQETISLLETEYNAAKYHGDEAFAQVADQLGVARHRFQPPDSIPATRWLDDLWLSVPDNATLLGAAEVAWEQNMTNPQTALNIVAQVLKGNTKTHEKIKCTLLISAIMLSSGQIEIACANANEVLRECGKNFFYRHLAGIAYYLRGRVFLELKCFRQAYWDFSLAVFTPGYHEKSKHFQQYTENMILQEAYREATRSSPQRPENMPLDLAPGKQPLLWLAPETTVPLDGFEFEKANLTPK